MSKTDKEMLRKFDAMFLDSDPSDLEVLHIRPNGVEVAQSGYNAIVKPKKYDREVKPREINGKYYIDVYDVLDSFNVTNQATGHAIKKLLAGGQRGHKDLLQDLNEAHASISRAIELELATRINSGA